jgi:hypothetical protein
MYHSQLMIHFDSAVVVAALNKLTQIFIMRYCVISGTSFCTNYFFPQTMLAATSGGLTILAIIQAMLGVAGVGEVLQYKSKARNICYSLTLNSTRDR